MYDNVTSKNLETKSLMGGKKKVSYKDLYL